MLKDFSTDGDGSHVKIGTADDYSPEERAGQYLRVFDNDKHKKTLTLLVRNDRYTLDGDGYMEYHVGSVAISREDALELAKWINERFGQG